MTTDTINGVRVTAPLFRKASPEALFEIIALLDRVSFHHASDYRNEDHLADRAQAEAATKAEALGLRPDALRHLFDHKPQMASFNDFLWSFVEAARARARTEALAEAEKQLAAYRDRIERNTTAFSNLLEYDLIPEHYREATTSIIDENKAAIKEKGPRS